MSALTCKRCRRVIELPSIEQNTRAGAEYAEFLRAALGSFLCFWCWQEIDNKLFRRHHTSEGAA
jgi:hypothetical protein